MAVTRAARAPHRAHGHMYMRTPIDGQKHAACCAALHPRLSSTCAPQIISAGTIDSHRRTCESVRMRESNGKVWPVQMADGMRVVMRPSGQGGFQVQKVAPWMCRGPATHSLCMRKLAQRQPQGERRAVWNHSSGSSVSKNHRERKEGKDHLLIVHGGLPPSLRMGVLRVRAPRLTYLGGGLPRNPTENVL